ncbi:MAG TPA: AMP-binding protein [Acidimicrobiales bacterium]|nr:AMP-binding protein [Acidimicrobiales bacterium]
MAARPGAQGASPGPRPPARRFDVGTPFGGNVEPDALGSAAAGAGTPLRGTFETVVDAMDAAVEQFGTAEAYVDGGQRVSFAAWIDAADRLAAALVDRGVRPGDVVAIVLPSSIDFAVAFAAALRAGAVATAVNTRLGPREVAAIMARCEPALAFVPGGCVPPGLPDGLPTVDRDGLERAARGPTLARPVRRSPTDPAVIVWTSGTTGLPKGAWFDHLNLRAAVTSAGVMTGPFDRRLASTPFAHAGYMTKLWEQLAWATTTVISPTPWRAADMLRLLVDERITVAGGAPAQWAKLLEQPALDDADLSALRLGIAATAPVPPELVAEVERRCGCPLVVRYAMTECPSITGTEPGDPPEVLHRSVGRPQAGIDVAIRDDHGHPVGSGEVGRVHVRGACVMRGYWNEPELTAEVLDDHGWLRSGDLGFVDAAGNLSLVGRVDDMYVRGGYNVYPLEVERVLDEHPAVAGAAVVGVPAPVLGEIGVAFITVEAGSQPPTLEELRTFCRERLADYKAPDRLEVVEALPLTAMMKVDKAALRALATAR